MILKRIFYNFEKSSKQEAQANPFRPGKINFIAKCRRGHKVVYVYMDKIKFKILTVKYCNTVKVYIK